MSCSCYSWAAVLDLTCERLSVKIIGWGHVLPVPSYIAVCLLRSGVLAWDGLNDKGESGGFYQWSSDRK